MAPGSQDPASGQDKGLSNTDCTQVLSCHQCRSWRASPQILAEQESRPKSNPINNLGHLVGFNRQFEGHAIRHPAEVTPGNKNASICPYGYLD